MRKAIIGDGGRLDLGGEAAVAGYRAGTTVQIVVLSTGSLLVTMDDEQPMDVPFKPLVGGAAQLAARIARRRVE